VLEVDHVAAHDDQVQPLGVLDVEVADGAAALVEDPNLSWNRLPGVAMRRPSASVKPSALSASP
jgi:hypothetical protein